jgi:cobalamin biosynthesis Mg chelatase CobN
VLALLALALFPVSAFARNAGETVYETEVPSITSEAGGAEKSPTHHKAHNTGNGETGRATGSNAETGGAGSEGSEKESAGSGGKKKSHGEKSSQESGGNPPTGGGGNGGKPTGGANAGSNGSIGEGQAVGNTQHGTNASQSSGGSSPVLPILIAVVILAAISIGVVLYRQRKSDQDGPDGRVSSPNAS